ncbi:MAG: hypothetical protein GKS00_24990 [Alphaproteobacteria bacterium]|nr:hypothetical protein [Alphaproteobacteria bacterium]
MAGDKKGDRHKDTVSDEEWARAMGEAEGSSNYTVGYGRPPKEHQFKPGQSGNPKGAPKKKKIRYFSSDQFDEDLIASLEQEVPVFRGGKQTKVPIILAIYDQLALKAAKGDFRSAKLAIDLLKVAVEKRENSLASLISGILEIDREYIDDAAANPGRAEEILRQHAEFRGSAEVMEAFRRVNRVMPKRDRLTPAEAHLENTTDLPWNPNEVTSGRSGKKKS